VVGDEQWQHGVLSSQDSGLVQTEATYRKFCCHGQGSIKALQPLQIPSDDDLVEVQSSWISVANVSFADMLCSVDKHNRDSPRNRRPGVSTISEPATSAPSPPII